MPTGQLASPCAQLVAAECDIQDSGVYGLLVARTQLDQDLCRYFVYSYILFFMITLHRKLDLSPYLEYLFFNETVWRMRGFKNLFLVAMSSQKKGTPWTENVVKVLAKFFNMCF